jgi:hypothetical protein
MLRFRSDSLTKEQPSYVRFIIISRMLTARRT